MVAAVNYRLRHRDLPVKAGRSKLRSYYITNVKLLSISTSPASLSGVVVLCAIAELCSASDGNCVLTSLLEQHQAVLGGADGGESQLPDYKVVAAQRYYSRIALQMSIAHRYTGIGPFGTVLL